ncbi:MAG: hypothetical protein KAR40_11220 [Candidatus Sabulitectum sp.]|nr:hypothetical protein [Candidatus Sabulitectum sp.]
MAKDLDKSTPQQGKTLLHSSIIPTMPRKPGGATRTPTRKPDEYKRDDEGKFA